MPEHRGGEEFGKLTLLKKFRKKWNGRHYREYWQCICECGTSVVRAKSVLIPGVNSSCGCTSPFKPHKLFEEGTRIYHFVLKSYCVKNHGSTWLCLCDCGKEFEVLQTLLKCKEQEVRSCGCKNKNRIRGPHHRSWDGVGGIPKSYLSTVVTSAKARDIELNIDFEFMWDLYVQQDGKCALTGLLIGFYDLPDSTPKRRGHSASLDRIDSSLPYSKDNVQWVHKAVNRMKGNLPEAEFINFCRLIADHKNSTQTNGESE